MNTSCSFLSWYKKERKKIKHEHCPSTLC